MENLGLSLYLRYREIFGDKIDFPTEGYPGDYVRDIAAEVKAQSGDRFLKGSRETAIDFFRQYGGDSLLNTIRAQLTQFGIHFDSFFSERALRERNVVVQTMTLLRSRGLLYSKDGAQWFKSTQFGDDKDRTVIKSDGELTYFASDIAYHRNKYERKFNKLINVWGADHHGYVPRLKAAMKGLGYDPDLLQVVLVQMVQLMRGGEPVRMGKRTGEFVSLEEVLEEVGCDAARFFFLMRKSDSHLDFDLDLAKKQSSENPVFYVQYAHARVASIFEQARKSEIMWSPTGLDTISIDRLELPEELELIRKMVQFNDVLEESVRELEPHRMIFYLLDLAGEFHRYYNRHRVISDDARLSRARLLLVENIQKTIRRGLEIVGVDAPLKWRRARIRIPKIAAKGEDRGQFLWQRIADKDKRLYTSANSCYWGAYFDCHCHFFPWHDRGQGHRSEKDAQGGGVSGKDSREAIGRGDQEAPGPQAKEEITFYDTLTKAPEAEPPAEEKPKDTKLPEKTVKSEVKAGKPPTKEEPAPAPAKAAVKTASPMETPAQTKTETTENKENDASWTVQVNAYPDERSAKLLVDQLKNKGYNAKVSEVLNKGKTWYRVRVGRYDSKEEAKKVERLLNGRIFLRHLPPAGKLEGE
jgi:cell division septation protein DedD